MKREVKKSIAHYDRMIAAVRKMSKEERQEDAAEYKMWNLVGENWMGKYCALCREHRCNHFCMSCPYFKKYGECGTKDRNAWRQIHDAETWSEWLLAANKVRRQLASLK